jgi:serine/threonine-protein kinase
MMRPVADELIGVDLGGQYHVERKVADAMLGRVYAARSLVDGRLYHVKVPYANVAGNAEKTERFRRELEAMARIESPHTIRVVDTGIHDSVAFLILEYLAATPLSVLLEKGPFAPERVAGIVAQIANACEAAHAAGIVHRNLSPQTVLLLDNAQDRDFVKVTDFGLSRVVDEDAEEAGGVLTQVGTRIGNVMYMAPEYIEQDEVLPAGDLYALGALTYHLLTGAPPFTGRAADVLTRHVTDEAPRPSVARPGLPAWCDALVARLMDKDPTRRPGARQVVASLEQEFGNLRAPKLLGIDEEGNVVRKSRAPVYFALFGVGVLAIGAVSAGLVIVAALALLLVSQAGTLLPESHDLAPSPGAAIAEPGAPPTDPPPPPPAPTTPPRPGAKPTAPPAPGPAPAPSEAPEPVSEAPAPEAPAPAPKTSTLRVGANQRALIHLDDVPVGYTPIELQVSPGRHVVAATLPSKASSRQEQSLDVVGTAVRSVDFSF